MVMLLFLYWPLVISQQLSSLAALGLLEVEMYRFLFVTLPHDQRVTRLNVDPSPILTILPSLVAASPAEFETNLF